MLIYNKIFSLLNKKNNQDSPNINLFKLLHEGKICNDYSYDILIKYKFFIFKNYYYHTNVTKNDKEIILDMFCKVQRHIHSLYTFKNVFLFKYKKLKGENIDLNFNNLDSIPQCNKISIVQENNKYEFNIFDIIRIMCTSLSNESDFFVEPIVIKNPWNNIPFSITNLYNIYLFIKDSNIQIPILIYRYFQSEFCIKKFKNENQLIIKQYIIDNYNNMPTDKIHSYIKQMIYFFNLNSLDSDKLLIDKKFPKEILLKHFKKYVKIFLNTKYSYESDIRIKNKILLKRRLRAFKREQPLFGRIMLSRYIKKLYYISRLFYEENIHFFCKSYIPRPEAIDLKYSHYYVDVIDNVNEYSIFPYIGDIVNVNNSNKPKQELNISELNLFIKNLTFSTNVMNTIHEKYKPITDNIIHEKYNSSFINYDSDDSLIDSIDSIDSDDDNDNDIRVTNQSHIILYNADESDDDDGIEVILNTIDDYDFVENNNNYNENNEFENNEFENNEFENNEFITNSLDSSESSLDSSNNSLDSTNNSLDSANNSL
jgi:hypothetical protein